MPWFLSFLVTIVTTVFYLYEDAGNVIQTSRVIPVPKKVREIKRENSQVKINKPVYIGANNEVPDNRMAIQYCVPNYQNSFLVPITKIIPHSDKKLFSLMKLLQQPLSKELGLVTAPPVTKISNAIVKEDTIEIDIEPLEERFKSSVLASNIYYSSIYHSIKHLPGIRKVQFLVDGKKKSEIFHATFKMDSPIELISTPEVYYCYNTINRRYLVPVPLNEKTLSKNQMSLKHIGDIVIKEMQKDVIFEGDQLMHLVPQNVKLIKVTSEQGIVHLLFNKQFAEAYGENYNMKKMMLDAILFSFTSLPRIEYVTLDIQNSSEKEFMGVALKKPLKRYKVINPIS